MLEKYLVDGSSVAWIRHGEGMVGLGCYACTDVTSPAEADAWWSTLVEGLDHHSQLPGVAGSERSSRTGCPPAEVSTSSKPVMPCRSRS